MTALNVFGEGLKNALNTKAAELRSAGADDGDLQRLKAFMDSEDHPVLKRMVLKSMERKTRAELHLDAKDKIDFGAIDWVALITKLMPFFLFILKIFFPVLPI